MDIFDQTVATYCTPEGAQGYVAKERIHEKRRNAMSYALLEGINLQGKRVLDVGCGFGRDVAYFRQCGAEAFGCDVSPALLAEAPEFLRPFLAVENLRNPGPFPFPGLFDMVWCAAVLVHVPRPEMPAVMARMWQALAPGGHLVLFTKQGEGERVMTNLGENLPRVMVYYTVEEIRHAVENLGGNIEILRGQSRILPTGDALMELRARKA